MTSPGFAGLKACTTANGLEGPFGCEGSGRWLLLSFGFPDGLSRLAGFMILGGSIPLDVPRGFTFLLSIEGKRQFDVQRDPGKQVGL